jgi:hypothetical protein
MTPSEIRELIESDGKFSTFYVNPNYKGSPWCNNQIGLMTTNPTSEQDYHRLQDLVNWKSMFKTRVTRYGRGKRGGRIYPSLPIGSSERFALYPTQRSEKDIKILRDRWFGKTLEDYLKVRNDFRNGTKKKVKYPSEGVNVSITVSKEDYNSLMDLRLQDDSGIIDHTLDHIEEKLEQL